LQDTKREGPIAGEWSAGSPLLAAAFIGLLVCTGPLVVQSFGFFIIPLATEFHWTRGQVAGASAVALIGLALAGPLHGLAIDRLGPRLPILFSVAGLSAALASMYLLAPPIWHLYAAFAAMTLLGASASPIGYSQILIRTFDKHRGFALGVAVAGVGMGTMLLSPVIQGVIGAYGWRIAYLMLAGLALIPLPICSIVLRNADLGAPGSRPEVAWSATDPVPSAARRIVLLAIIFFILGLVSVGFGTHLVSRLADAGFSRGYTAAAVMLSGLTVVLTRVGLGWLVDNVHAPFVLASATLALALACVLFMTPPSLFVAAVAVVMFGIGAGAELDLMSFLVSRYWPARSFGKIYGLLFGIFSIGSAVGPIFLGIMFDRLGSYHIALGVAAGCSVANAALCLGLPRYRKGIREPLTSSATVPRRV
jgi:MFS family permease